MAEAEFRQKAKPPHTLRLVWEAEDGTVAHEESFLAVPTAPAGIIIDLAGLNEDDAMTNFQKMQRVVDFADDVFLPESAGRFARLMRSTEWPIDEPMLTWSIEQLVGFYGGRPTQPSSPSEDGQQPTGTSSTDGSPSEGSIPSTSPSTDT